MENTTLDMQAFLNTKGGIGLFLKEQDKSPVGNEHGDSTLFVNLLDEKTTQVANNDKPDEEKIKEIADRDAINSDFTGIQAFVPLPPETGHQLRKGVSLSKAGEIKPLPLADESKLPIFSLSPLDPKSDISEGMLKPTMPMSTEMAIHPRPVIQHSSDEDSLMTIVQRKESRRLSDDPNLLHLTIPTKNATDIQQDNELKQLIPPIEDTADQISRAWENSTFFKSASASTAEEKTHGKIDPSVTQKITATRNSVKLTIPLSADTKDQSDPAQSKNTQREYVSMAFGATDADTPPLPELESSSADHIKNHIRSAKSEHQTETESMDRMAEILQQKDSESATDSILRRMTVSHRDNRTDRAVQKEGRYIAAATQNPVPAVNDRVALAGQAVSNDFQVELPDSAVFMKSSPAGITAANHGDQQLWDAAPDRHHMTPNQNEFPLRTEMANIFSIQGNRSSTTNSPAGINTQAVIEQILDAKQSLNNGFGRVRITLDPPNLGTVNLEIVVRKERVEVVITADNSGVQQALQSRADDIRAALQRQDLKIETFQVLLQENTANQQQANSGAMFGHRQEHQARQHLMNDNIPPVQPLIQPIRESARARGLVSIFV